MLIWEKPVTFENTAVYYERGDYIVHNHHVNGWIVATPAEYHLISQLRQGLTPEAVLKGMIAAGEEATRARQTLGKLMMRLVLYRVAYQGERPQHFDPPPEERTVPIKAYFVCTNRCNLTCSYCYAESGPHWDTSKELNTAEALDLVDQIAAMGIKGIIFTGGEALTRPDLFELAARAKERGLATTLITNGSAITLEKAERIATLFDSVSLSLDSLHPEEHDHYRGQGAHAQAMRGLNYLRQTGIPIQINTTVTDKSATHFVDLVDWTVEEGLKMKYAVVAEIGRGSEDFGVSWDDNLALRTRLREHQEEIVLKRARESGQSPEVGIRQFQVRHNCGHGFTQLSVDAFGNVYPCRLFHEPDKLAGNVRQTPLAEIWQHSPIFNRPDYANTEKLDLCSQCTFRRSCAGNCRAIAAGATDDYYGVLNVECPSIRRDIRLQMWYYFRRDEALAASSPQNEEVGTHAGD